MSGVKPDRWDINQINNMKWPDRTHSKNNGGFYSEGAKKNKLLPQNSDSKSKHFFPQF